MPVGRFYHCDLRDKEMCPTPDEASLEFCKSCGEWRPNFSLVPNRERYRGIGDAILSSKQRKNLELEE